MFYISASGDTGSIHHDNKDLPHEVCTLPWLFQGFLGRVPKYLGNPLLQFLLHFHAPFLMGEVKNLLFIRCCTDIYICTFSVYPNICTFCMYNRRRQQVYKDLFCSVFVLFENSRQSLFIIPLDIFGFPPVRSDRKHLLLSMETAQSVFNKNKSAWMLPL